MEFINELGQARILARSGAIWEAIEVYLALAMVGSAQAKVELAILYFQNRDLYGITETEIKDLLHDAIESEDEEIDRSQAISVLTQILTSGKINERALTDSPKDPTFPHPLVKPSESSIMSESLLSDWSDSSESLIPDLQKKVTAQDPAAMVTLATLYLHNPGITPDALGHSYRLLKQAIALGHEPAKKGLIPLAKELIRDNKRITAEHVLYESLYFGNQDAVPEILYLFNNRSTEIKSLLRNIAISPTIRNIDPLVRVMRKYRYFTAAEFWLKKLHEIGSDNANIELALFYRCEVKQQDRYEELVRNLENTNPYQYSFIQAQFQSDLGNFTEAIRLFRVSLSNKPHAVNPIINIFKIFSVQDDENGFIDWLQESENHQFIPILKKIAERYLALSQQEDYELWVHFSELATRSGKNPDDAAQTEVSTESNSASDAGFDDLSYEKWLASGENHIKTIFIHKNSPFLRALFKLNREFCPLIENWMQYSVTEEWLDEILAKYEDQSEFLRLEPEWPLRFESPELQIVLSVEGQWIRGWVGRQGIGGLVAIRIANFEILTALKGEDRNFAVGILTAFFLDRTISLDSDGHPHFETQTDGSIFGTTQFDLDIVQSRSGQRRPMQSHMVAGYARQLPEGHQPSHEAIMRAPIYVRRNLKPGQTFVRGHQRNGPVIQEQVLRYLRTNSNLADAVGAIDRH